MFVSNYFYLLCWHGVQYKKSLKFGFNFYPLYFGKVSFDFPLFWFFPYQSGYVNLCLLFIKSFMNKLSNFNDNDSLDLAYVE
jgi:hypothetical protein